MLTLTKINAFHSIATPALHPHKHQECTNNQPRTTCSNLTPSSPTLTFSQPTRCSTTNTKQYMSILNESIIQSTSTTTTLPWQIFWLLSGSWNLILASNLRAGNLPGAPTEDATAKINEILVPVELFGISYAARAFFLNDFLILVPLSAAAKIWAVNFLRMNGLFTKKCDNDDDDGVWVWRGIALVDLVFAVAFVWFYCIHGG